MGKFSNTTRISLSIIAMIKMKRYTMQLHIEALTWERCELKAIAVSSNEGFCRGSHMSTY